MPTFQSEPEERDSALLKYEGHALPCSPKQVATAPTSETSTVLQFLRHLWKAVKGYTAEDISRLKEGGVQKVEGEGLKAVAEARAKIAEATKLHAEAEALQLQARGQYAKDMATALREFADAMHAIRQKGGVVAFDERELLQRIVGSGYDPGVGIHKDGSTAQSGSSPNPSSPG